MRDPDRIDEMLGIIKSVWEQYPDLRLSQLLLNTGMTYNTEEHELAYKLGVTYVPQQEIRDYYTGLPVSLSEIPAIKKMRAESEKESN